MIRFWLFYRIRMSVWPIFSSSRRPSPGVFTLPSISSAYAGAGLDRGSSIRLNLAVGGGLDTESSIIRPETRFNVPRGAIFGYHGAQFEEFI